MKAILEFDLPEDEHEFRRHIDGPKAFWALSDIKEYLRGQVKYVEPEQRDDTETIYKRLHQALLDHGIEL